MNAVVVYWSKYRGNGTGGRRRDSSSRRNRGGM